MIDIVKILVNSFVSNCSCSSFGRNTVTISSVATFLRFIDVFWHLHVLFTRHFAYYAVEKLLRNTFIIADGIFDVCKILQNFFDLAANVFTVLENAHQRILYAPYLRGTDRK